MTAAGASSPAGASAAGASGATAVLAFARLSFRELVTYRVRYAVGIINYVIYMAVQYFLWSAVYASAAPGTGTIGGYPLEDLITYFAVGWIVRVFYYNNIDREFADRVSQGDIVIDLLRPVSLLQRFYGEALGEAASRAFLMALPTALVLFPAFGARAPALPPGLAGAAAAAAFALSVILAFHVFFLINFAIGATTVFFEKIRGLLWAKFVIVQFLSGLLVPFELFPPAARAVLEVLPFRGMAYGPLSIYLGKVSGASLAVEVAIQAAWVLALHVFCRWLWSRCRRKLLIAGG